MSKDRGCWSLTILFYAIQFYSTYYSITIYIIITFLALIWLLIFKNKAWGMLQKCLSVCHFTGKASLVTCGYICILEWTSFPFLLLVLETIREGYIA